MMLISVAGVLQAPQHDDINGTFKMCHVSELNVVTFVLAKFSRVLKPLFKMPSVLVFQIGCFCLFGIPYILTF
jgi:hypothetical protein